MMHDQVEHLLDALDDPILCQIAAWKIEGTSNVEIAARLGRTLRTVERKIEIIRLVWERIGRVG